MVWELTLCFGFSGHLQGVQGPKGQKGEPYIVAPEIISRHRVRTSATPSSSSCPVQFCRHMMESNFFLHMHGQVPRGPLWFERQLPLSLVAANLIWCPRERIWTQLLPGNVSLKVDCKGTVDDVGQAFPSLFNDYLCIMHGKILSLP